MKTLKEIESEIAALDEQSRRFKPLYILYKDNEPEVTIIAYATLSHALQKQKEYPTLNYKVGAFVFSHDVELTQPAKEL